MQDYHTKYNEDLLVRLTNRGSLHLDQKLNTMYDAAERRYKAAAFKGDKPIVMNTSIDELAEIDQLYA